MKDIVRPTIKTVETTANAKIFFETHFNSILSDEPESRSLRRRTFEQQLSRHRFPMDQQDVEKRYWTQHESDHLRRTRILKGRSRRVLNSPGVCIDNYEVIRVIGKGSFGVVRLVRERKGGSVLQSCSCPWQPRMCPRTLSSCVSNVDDSLGPGLKKQVDYVAEVFAMKVIRKSEMLRSNQEGHLRAERDFLVASERSKWVVPLIASFQDKKNLYLVMEYMIGGDFLGLLIQKDRLDEESTQFYIAEMILCLEEAHKLNWIHRDVKPDNFLISASGHLKISDFGLAFDGHWTHDQSYFSCHRYSLLEKLGIKIIGDAVEQSNAVNEGISQGKWGWLKSCKETLALRRHYRTSTAHAERGETVLQWRNRRGRRSFAKSVVGTSQYMAPEVVRGDCYDGRCDWWSIGIIMFEV